MRRFILLISLVISMNYVMLACSSSPDGMTADIGGCSCAPDQICVSGACLDRVPLQGSHFGVEIYDVRSSSVTQGQVLYDVGPDGMSYDASGIMELKLPPPFHIRGTVSTPGDRIATTVTVYRDSVIPGHGLISKSQPLGMVGNDDLAISYDFEFRRPADYTVQVIPQNIQQAAPVQLDAFVDDSTSIDIDIGMPALTMEGTLIDGEGRPVSGATVWGLDSSLTTVSTAAVTDASGFFRVWFSEVPGDLNIYVGPSESKVTIPGVAFRFGASYADEFGYDAQLGIMNLGTLEIPALPAPVVYSTKVVGVSQSGVEEPVSGARVVFYARVGGGTHGDGVYVAEGTTDRDGRISLQLIPGEEGLNRTYDVVVVPPLDSPYAYFEKEVEVGPVSGVGEQLRLEPRPVLVGRVTDPQGRGMADVLVSAQLEDATGLDLYLLSDYRPQVRTGSDGAFSLPLNPGTYTVTVKFSDYPARVLQGVMVPSDDELVVAAEIPGIIPVRVLDESGVPLSGVEVRLYSVPEGCEASECDVPAYMIYSAYTDTDGSVMLMAPVGHDEGTQ